MAGMDLQSIQNLKNLSALLNPDHEESSDDDMPDADQSSFTPGSIASNKKKKEVKTPYEKSKGNENDIWADEELQELSVFADENETRPQPEYDISYKQKVTTEDMFLGTTGKTPSSACCEGMVVKIKLPECAMKDVELDVKDTFLDCRCPKYRLLLSLPHPVDSKKGTAKWDGNKETLEVSLVMTREYDFVNFQ